MKNEVGKSRQTMAKIGKLLAVVILCFIAGLGGSWVMLRSGWVSLDASQAISQNREKIVVQEGEVVADAAKKVGPSAVSISTESLGRRGYFGARAVEQGAGSGIIISKDGYVLTNKHVVPEGVSKVVVTLSDGTEFTEVKVVGRDPINDLAFLKIEGVKDLKAAELADSSEVQVGQKVIAVGNALGEFQNTVTSGIISGIGRPLVAGSASDNSAESLENLFQTDAAINPGNSGGPLVNINGQVIGINTAIAEQAQGIGFAIPINQAKGLIKNILAGGKLARPYLGVRYVALDSQKSKELGLAVKQGAYILGDEQTRGVLKGSPAEKAGLQEKDIILKINGKTINEKDSLASLLAVYAPNDKVELTILRAGKEQKVTVQLGEFGQ